MNVLANNYPELNFQFTSNGRVWKVIGVDKKIAQIKLECERESEIDTIDLDMVAYRFLLKFGFLIEQIKTEPKLQDA